VKKLIGDRLQLIGEDWVWLPCMSIGVNGVQSVVGSIFPKLMVEMYDNFKKGNVAKALQTQILITPLMEPLGVGIGGDEPNPSPLKAILNMLGRPSGSPRLPLVPASEELKKELKSRLIQVDPSLKSKLK
jgi:4-hydroxy-tetrahydrodipicolinate synthase